MACSNQCCFRTLPGASGSEAMPVSTLCQDKPVARPGKAAERRTQSSARRRHRRRRCQASIKDGASQPARPPGLGALRSIQPPAATLVGTSCWRGLSVSDPAGTPLWRCPPAPDPVPACGRCCKPRCCQSCLPASGAASVDGGGRCGPPSVTFVLCRQSGAGARKSHFAFSLPCAA